MKRLITIILILVLAVPAAAFSESNNDTWPAELIGCWTIFVPEALTFGYGCFTCIVVLNEDHSAVFMTTISSKEDKKISYTAITAQWWLKDGTVYLYGLKDNDTYTFAYKDQMIWLLREPYKFGLKKTSDIELNQFVFIDQ